MIPYTVFGLVIVSSGVISRGVVAPNAAIDDGMNTFRSLARAYAPGFSNATAGPPRGHYQFEDVLGAANVQFQSQLRVPLADRRQERC